MSFSMFSRNCENSINLDNILRIFQRGCCGGNFPPPPRRPSLSFDRFCGRWWALPEAPAPVPSKVYKEGAMRPPPTTVGTTPTEEQEHHGLPPPLPLLLGRRGHVRVPGGAPVGHQGRLHPDQLRLSVRQLHLVHREREGPGKLQKVKHKRKFVLFWSHPLLFFGTGL